MNPCLGCHIFATALLQVKGFPTLMFVTADGKVSTFDGDRYRRPLLRALAHLLSLPPALALPVKTWSWQFSYSISIACGCRAPVRPGFCPQCQLMNHQLMNHVIC